MPQLILLFRPCSRAQVYVSMNAATGTAGDGHALSGAVSPSRVVCDGGGRD